MNPRPWHCDASLLRRYTANETDMALAASIEAHLLRCASCRSRLADLADPVALDQVWLGVRASIQQPSLSWPLRLLRRAGLKEEDAVLLSAAQLLRGPRVLATIVVLLFAVIASWRGNTDGQAMYLLVAPLVPVLGVVAAFAATDPLTELTNATSYPKARLALLRTLAVAATSAPLVVVIGAAVPGIGWLALAWLGPAVGLTLAALVGLTWWPPMPVGAAISIAWTVVVAVAYSRHDISGAVQADAQIAYVIVAGLTAAALVLRIRSAHTPGGYA